MSTVKANTIEPASGGTVTITGAALTTPALGTPASGNLANCTGLPASAVVNTPAGGISETTVQGALNGLESRKANVSSPTFTGVATSPHFQASGGAPGFSISNQETGGARGQFQNAGGTFYLGIDNSSGGLVAPYTINYYYTGNYDQVWSINSGEKMRLTTAGSLYNVTGTYGTISDAKLKRDVTDTGPKLSKVLAMRIVNYYLKADQTNSKMLGVIAQELREISPGLIDEQPEYERVLVEPERIEVQDDGSEKVLDAVYESRPLGTVTLTVKWSIVVPMLVKAMQEMHADFDGRLRAIGA